MRTLFHICNILLCVCVCGPGPWGRWDWERGDVRTIFHICNMLLGVCVALFPGEGAPHPLLCQGQENLKKTKSVFPAKINVANKLVTQDNEIRQFNR